MEDHERGGMGCAGAADCSYATGITFPYGLALDPSSGALYVTSQYTNTVCVVPRGGGARACVGLHEFDMHMAQSHGVLK